MATGSDYEWDGDSSAQKASIMMSFRNVVVIANLTANSWTGSRLEQMISQFIVAIHLKIMLLFHPWLMCLLSKFHTNETYFPEWGHPHGITTHYFVVSEMRHVIFYGHKKSLEPLKLKWLHNKTNSMDCPFKGMYINTVSAIIGL